MCCSEIANKSSYGVFLGGSTRSTGSLHIRIRIVVAFSTGINFAPSLPFVLCGHVGNYLPSAAKLKPAPAKATFLLAINLTPSELCTSNSFYLHFHPSTYGSYQHIVRTEINHKASYSAINLLFRWLNLIAHLLLNITDTLKMINELIIAYYNH